MSSQKLDTVLQILLGEHEKHRSEVSQMADRHVRITLIMTISEMTLYGASHTEMVKGEPGFHAWLPCGIMVLVLAQIALIFNNHYFVIALLSEYISLLEEKIVRITEAPILEYEAKYVPLYFNSPTFGKADKKTPRSVLSFLTCFFREPHFLFESMLFVPSLLLVCFCCIEVFISRQLQQDITTVIILSLFIVFALAFRAKKKRLHEQFRRMREDSRREFTQYLSGIGTRSIS